MNAEVKRKPTKTRLNAAVNPVAEAVQTIALHDAQTIIFKMDKAIEDLTNQRNEFDLAACIMSDMLTESDAECDRLREALFNQTMKADILCHRIERYTKGRKELECAKADLCTAQAKIKRLEHSADYWRDAWVKANRALVRTQCGSLAVMLLIVVFVWGAS